MKLSFQYPPDLPFRSSDKKDEIPHADEVKNECDSKDAWQYIIDAINNASKNGCNRVVIPIVKYGDEIYFIARTISRQEIKRSPKKTYCLSKKELKKTLKEKGYKVKFSGLLFTTLFLEIKF